MTIRGATDSGNVGRPLNRANHSNSRANLGGRSTATNASEINAYQVSGR